MPFYFPVSPIASSKIRTRLEAPFTSAELNAWSKTNPRGIVRGFVPVPTGKDHEIELEVDAIAGESVALVGGGTGAMAGYHLLVRETSNVILDLSSFAPVGPGNVTYLLAIVADYTTSGETTAKYVLYDTSVVAEIPIDGALYVCSVTLQNPPGPVEVSYTYNTLIRDDVDSNRGATEGGILEKVADIRLGDTKPNVYIFSPPTMTLSIDPSNTLSGIGSLKADSGSFPDSVIVRVYEKWCVPVGDEIVVDITYKTEGVGTLDTSLSAVSFRETEYDGSLIASAYAYTPFANTTDWTTLRVSHKVQNAPTGDWAGSPTPVVIIIALASAANEATWVDSVRIYVQKRNAEVEYVASSIQTPALQSIRLLNPSGGNTASNPYQNTLDIDVSNSEFSTLSPINAPNLPKAWGHALRSGGNWTKVAGGYNIDTISGGGFPAVVTFDNAMSGTNYVVIGNYYPTTIGDSVVTYLAGVVSTSFNLEAMDSTDGTAYTPVDGDRIHFVVYEA